MQIELGRVLWRTRGRTWDYSFVLRPAQPHIENWYGFHTEVFAGTTPGVAPVSVGGTLRTASDDVVSFVATVFQDDTLADLAGRPVVHYLVWFRHSTGEVTDLEVPPNWGSQLVRALGDEWRSLFESNGSSADDVLTDTRWGSRCAALSDSGRVRIPLSRHVIEKKKTDGRQMHNEPRIGRAASDSNRTYQLLLVSVIALLIFGLLHWISQR